MELGTWANVAELLIAGVWAKDKAEKWQEGWTEERASTLRAWWFWGTIAFAVVTTLTVLVVAPLILWLADVNLLYVLLEAMNLIGEIHHNHDNDLHSQLSCLPE